MNRELIASFRIDITSARDHTWQGRVRHGEESRSFESELEMLRYMIELAPGLAPDIRWDTYDSQNQEETT